MTKEQKITLFIALAGPVLTLMVLAGWRYADTTAAQIQEVQNKLATQNETVVRLDQRLEEIDSKLKDINLRLRVMPMTFSE